MCHSKNELERFFSAAGAHIKQVPAERKSEFLNDFVTAYCQQAGCAADAIPVSFWCLQILAVKT
ncbi:hypothetical protein [Legionella septentrionalis]|uniref:Uncharacterized protein n=1 Tax=Legionella septentrionalis TaxID=2498109 RepID=A0A433JK26_9GAMM|nr:hypothetical protein [Legionella septentrionalis]RUQ88852.1 hypothetical protein EKM59_04765 [Legionella septentrionalis]RUR02964.1 hypothetical protein ELY11_01000 [Legionella septentrionalis]RUR11563.1 hypothetical protein ELY14_02110 [Legionella septentrionalis]RUR16829.1 hypothetical protein ELY10_02825 [Legionella septentrionalis]